MERAKEEESTSFCEQKEAKTLISSVWRRSCHTSPKGNKSFLLLFSKKKLFLFLGSKRDLNHVDDIAPMTARSDYLAFEVLEMGDPIGLADGRRMAV